MAMSWTQRVRSGWKRHEIRELPSLLIKNLRFVARSLADALIPRHSARGREVSEFDCENGTDTDSVREVGSLRIDSSNARYAVRYEPSPSSLVIKLIDDLDIAHDNYTFIDFGAGKGRILLIAAQFPFVSVVGVEFARELCDIANANIARVDRSRWRTASVECVHVDATCFDIPTLPIVCYFYNPFGEFVLRAVVERLIASWVRLPRPILVIYVNPLHRNVFESDRRWAMVRSDHRFAVYSVRALPRGDQPESVAGLRPNV